MRKYSVDLPRPQQQSLARTTWTMVPQVLLETAHDEGNWWVMAMAAPAVALLLAVCAFVFGEPREGPRLAIITAVAVIPVVLMMALAGSALTKALPLSRRIARAHLERAEVIEVRRRGAGVSGLARLGTRKVRFSGELPAKIMSGIQPGAGVMLLVSDAGQVLATVGLAPEAWEVAGPEQEQEEAILQLRERVAQGRLELPEYGRALGEVLHAEKPDAVREVLRRYLRESEANFRS